MVHLIQKALKEPNNSVYYYSDSTIVLSWIQRSPAELRTFVATRVSIIQSLTNIKQWKHVRSSDNSADILSRGFKSQNLIHNNLWWSGGPQSSDQNDFVSNFSEPGETQSENDRHLYQEFKSSIKLNTMMITEMSFSVLDVALNLSNNYFKNVRIFCYALQFIKMNF